MAHELSDQDKAKLLYETCDRLMVAAATAGDASPSVIMTALIGNVIVWNARYGQDREDLIETIRGVEVAPEERANEKVMHEMGEALNAVVVDFNTQRKTTRH